MDNKFLSFPEGFKWGAAVWAQGTEGAYDADGKSLTVFEKYALDQPSRMQQGIGPFETLNWYSDYEKYVDHMEDLKLNSFRTSISWARLMPDGVNVNPEAAAFYKKMFGEIKKRGISLWIVLYWFDMPLHLEDRGGFSSREVVDLFEDYAKTCFDLFSEYVDIFYVYNEPSVDVRFKYYEDICYPNEMDYKKAQQTIYNMIVAHAKAVKAFKAADTKESRIGTVLNLKPAYPRSQHKSDLEASRIWTLLHQKVWLDPLIKGSYPEEMKTFLKGIDLLPEMQPEDEVLIRENTIEVLGINHYFPIRVKAKEHVWHQGAPLKPEAFYDLYSMPGRKMNKDRGWEIYPRAMYDMLMDIKENYQNIECYITENGMGRQNEGRYRDGEGVIADDYRIEYVSEYLEACHQAIVDGVNLKGYHMWSFVDLWSPTNQFLNCYGFVEFDPDTKETRLKKSGYWYRDVILANGLTPALPSSERK